MVSIMSLTTRCRYEHQEEDLGHPDDAWSWITDNGVLATRISSTTIDCGMLYFPQGMSLGTVMMVL